MVGQFFLFHLPFEMADFKEQRICIKSCFNLKKTAAETHRMLKEAFGDLAMSKSKTFLWYKRFKEGRTSIYDDERSGRPSTGVTLENIGKVRDIIRVDRRQTIHDVCDIVGMSYGTVQRILADVLYMRRIAAKFVPRLLGDEQKQHRLAICRQLREKTKDDPNFITKIITGDEVWLYGYDVEVKPQSPRTKKQSSSARSEIQPLPSETQPSETQLAQSETQSPRSLHSNKPPRPRKPRHVRNNIKSILIVFFDIQGIVHKEFIPAGQTVNGNFYCDVLKRLLESIQCKRPSKWMSNDWALHHDNTPAHTSVAVTELLASKNVTVIPHPNYSPDLAPCDFFLFPKLKFHMKGRCFDTVEEIEAESQRVLDTITRTDFQQCMESWKNRWDRCLLAQGNYFDGDGGN